MRQISLPCVTQVSVACMQCSCASPIRLRCFIHRLISPMHQTVVKFIGWSIESDKITLLKIKFNQENCQQKDTPAAHIKTNVTSYDWFTKVLFYSVFYGWKFDASMHTSVRSMHRWNQPMNKTTQPYCKLRGSRPLAGAAPRFWKWGDNFASGASKKFFLTPHFLASGGTKYCLDS